MTVADFLGVITSPKLKTIISDSAGKVLVEMYKHENNYLADSINSATVTQIKINGASCVTLGTNLGGTLE